MGKQKKVAKGRLDKYYHLAKEQGYRARSAFKLIQLNKKYGFLEKARVLVDLCAAPGGWLQVAAKYMPVSKIIIGFDLVPIKPIPGVITFATDITSEKCRQELRKELKTWKVDVFLHDGAPNVGAAWVQDAFSQSELVLKSLKLAVEFLTKGGTFVTKVFRSKDYNALIWVFHQLFAKVEATKPPSSRNVSAEIFVVCRDFLAPKVIDPKMLDAKYVFMDVEQIQKPVNIFQPEKRVRHRDGYEDGVMILHKTVTAYAFVTAQDPMTVLGMNNAFTFESDQDKSLLQFAETTEDIRIACEDLKVLGKKDFKALLKWRLKMREYLKLDEEKEEKTLVEEVPKDALEEQEDVAASLAQLSKEEQRRRKREKRRLLERKARARMRMQMGMEVENDTGLSVGEEGLFALKQVKTRSVNALDDDQGNDSANESNDEEKFLDSASESDEVLDSEEERNEKLDDLERSLDKMYDAYRERQQSRDTKFQVKKKRAAEEEWTGFSENVEEDDEATDLDETANPLIHDLKDKDEASKKAALWFSQPLFQELDESEMDEKTSSKRQRTRNDSSSDSDSSDSDTNRHQRLKANRIAIREAKKSRMQEDAKSSDFEVVKAASSDSEDEFTAQDKAALMTPEGVSVALQIMDPEKKRELMDGSYNRYAFNDTKGLPSWFVEDESMHNKPQKPVTKEAVAALKAKLKALDARPIKKVMEAKGRQKLRTMQRIEKMKKKADALVDNPDMNEKQKLEQIQKMMKKSGPARRKQVKLVVARGHNKAQKGRPKGVKGRYKMVDSRMRKEMRAEKRRDQKRK